VKYFYLNLKAWFSSFSLSGMYITGSVRSSAVGPWENGKHIHESWHGANHAQLPAQTTTSFFGQKRINSASIAFNLTLLNPMVFSFCFRCFECHRTK
jgi:hypothetical protein